MLKKIQFFLPLTLPLIIYLLIEGALALYPEDLFTQIFKEPYFFPLSFYFLIVLFFSIHLLMPVVIQKFWKCRTFKGPMRHAT